MAPIPDSGAAAVEVGDDSAGESAETHEEKDQALPNIEYTRALRLWQTTCNRNSSKVNWSSILATRLKQQRSSAY
ncbi:LOW QUALITY PROTEIN: hypothetical protein TorRG33x02_049520 [Trema orientale]|uniref:Uncharacterized protein n=1 Tax=Trema orientale TaxID=63057 RepID=A0A2P5FNP3_TREOI|nr:LOW QUALITY PROTEIN: hypothetical protein TorRG33x02_049520 [Trema orientale]